MSRPFRGCCYALYRELCEWSDDEFSAFFIKGESLYVEVVFYPGVLKNWYVLELEEYAVVFIDLLRSFIFSTHQKTTIKDDISHIENLWVSKFFIRFIYEKNQSLLVNNLIFEFDKSDNQSKEQSSKALGRHAGELGIAKDELNGVAESMRKWYEVHHRYLYI